MKKLSILVALVIITASCRGNENKAADSLAVNSDKQETKLKRYEVKSAMVTYKTIVSGKVMGSTISGSGTESLYFKNWGDLELKEAQSSQTTTSKFFGKSSTQTTETHTMNKLDNGKSYHVDFERKIIMLRRDMAMEMNKMFADGDVNKTGKQMLEGMGGKIVGQGSVLGYNCDIWDVMGAKQWIYKGLPLKIEVSIMGITTVTKAVTAKFDVSVADKYFKLPNFPIEEMEDYQNDEEYEEDRIEMKKNAQKMKNMTYAEYKAMVLKDDPEAAEMSEEEMKQGYQMFKMMMKKMAN
ncbi:MAG TPA: hypothetical protein EYG92_00550 [Lutibacter sp.]|nr:hypothetical protein [Lutibacter sp.]